MFFPPRFAFMRTIFITTAHFHKSENIHIFQSQKGEIIEADSMQYMPL